MLGYIRESIQGWIAAFIIAILIVPFALWGINEYFGPASSLVVAEVNDEEITSIAYKDAFYRQRDNIRQMMGGRYDPDMWDKRLQEQALDGLINRSLLYQAADDAGFGISKQNVQQYIQSIDAFKRDGKYAHDLYLQLLSSSNQSPAQFEQEVQRDMLTQQISSAVNASSFATTSEIERIHKIEAQTRDIDYLIIPLANYKKDEVATDDAIQKYYNDHVTEFMTPEQVSLEYVELDAKKLDIKFEPTESAIQDYYNARSAQYNLPEERRTSHILFTVEEGADEKAIAAAKQKALDVKAKLDKGESFEKLAKEFSEDPGSKDSGGDLGFFGQGSLDPNYEKTMYALKLGEVSEPVLSKFGYHIIKLTEINAAKTKALDEVKNEILAEMKQAEANKHFHDLADKLTNLAYEVPDSLQDAAGAVGLPVQSTELFTRTTPAGIAKNPKVMQAAFKDEVLAQGYNSEPIELGENHVVVIRVKEHKVSEQKPLDQVKAEVKLKVINDDAKRLAKEAGEAALKKLESATDENARKNLAGELKVDWKKQENVDRNFRKIDQKIVNGAFSTKKPEAGKSTFGGVQLVNGDFALFVVNKVTDGDISKLDDAKKTSLRRTLSGVEGSELFSQYLEEIKSQATITKYEDRL